MIPQTFSLSSTWPTTTFDLLDGWSVPASSLERISVGGKVSVVQAVTF